MGNDDITNWSIFVSLSFIQGGDHHARWEYRRRRLASKRYGVLKPEEFSRQESGVSGARPPPALLDAVSAFASNKATSKEDWLLSYS